MIKSILPQLIRKSWSRHYTILGCVPPNRSWACAFITNDEDKISWIRGSEIAMCWVVVPQIIDKERIIIGTYYPNSRDKLILGRVTPSHTVSLLGCVPPRWSRAFYANLLEKVDQGITPYWVVFPQVEVEHVHSSRTMKTKFIECEDQKLQCVGSRFPKSLTNEKFIIGTYYPTSQERIDIGTCRPKPHSLTIGSCSPKLIMCIHHERRGRNFLNHWSETAMCWVVFLQIIDKWKVYYWDVLPQFTW